MLTNGFAAEFGNTPGIIVNTVTPSGTNKISGAVSYRFCRPSLYSRPFFFPAADLPQNKADNFMTTIGASIIKNRWHFYAAYENGKRDDKAIAARLLTISESNTAQLIAAGVSPSIFPSAIQNFEGGPLYLFRSDLQINAKNRLAVRFNFFKPISENFITGALNTLERTVDAAVSS